MPEIRKKKILYLITKSNWGGAQRYVFDLATHLDPKRFEVAVALGGNGRLTEELARKGVRTIVLKNLERDISIFKEIKSTIELFKILRTEGPDILHINSSKAGGLGTVLGRIVGIPHIIFTAHGWAFNEERPVWQKLIIACLHWITIQFTHTTIAVSETTKKQMRIPFAHRKMRVIHNGRTIAHTKERDEVRDFFCTRIPLLAQHHDELWSVTIGELHPIKQHDVVIRAVKKVVETNRAIRHIIIGEGEEHERLQHLIQELGLSAHVFLAGSILEAAEYLKGFDLFVLGSKSEGLAYVLIEAASAGLPTIASNVGGIPEVIQHNVNGLLVQEGNVDQLAKAYIRLLDDPHFRTKLAECALTNSQNFTFEQMLGKTVALYEEKGS